MKRKIILLLAIAIGAVMLFSTSASAAGGWYKCTVAEAGIYPASGSCFVQLTHVQTYSGDAWSGTQIFRVPATGETKSLLATALSAMASEKPVKVNLEDIAAYSNILQFYMMEQ